VAYKRRPGRRETRGERGERDPIPISATLIQCWVTKKEEGKGEGKRRGEPLLCSLITTESHQYYSDRLKVRRGRGE